MDFTLLATEEWIEELKCTVCGNYLSYFPIHTSPDGKNVCGRCPLPSEGCFRIEIYEIAAQNTTFPCRYRSEGCCEILVPKDIPNHEEVCEYRTIECLTQVFTECNVKASPLNMTKHCHEQHSKYFLKDGKFEIDLTESHITACLLEHENEIHILTVEFEHKGKSFVFKLSPPIYYNLVLSCGGGSVSINYKNIHKKEVHEICLGSLLGSQETKVSVDIYLKANMDDLTTVQNLQQELSKLWKCSSCSKYAQYIYNRDVCDNCRRSFYSRNTSFYTKVDGLATLIKFSCKNASIGCNFSGQLSETEDHQKFCQFDPQACPLLTFTSCRWTGITKNLVSHFLEEHHSIFVNSSSMVVNITNNKGVSLTSHPSVNNYYYNCYNYYDTQTIRSYILKFSPYFFNLCYVEWDQRNYWIMQMIGEFKDMFKYEIEFYAEPNMVPQLILTQSCCKQSTKDELLSNLHNYYYISSEQIQDYFKMKQIIRFKVRILKKLQ